MSYAFDSRLGRQLYQLLPEVYRTRDKKSAQAGEGSGREDLARYLDAHGHLLDLIHATMEQQLRDALPESSQDWLLPYFAQLLAARIVSPEPDGRHAEIANAVSWRQRKGTLKCVEEIAEAIGQMEVEIQEGWQRVAMTPRIGMPLMPSRIWDDTLDINMTIPSEAIRHPTLPAAMMDLRRSSRAVEALSTNPAARVSSFAGVKQTWRQTNYHGVPCFPGGFDDVSRRTVDMRTADIKNGHYHHKRLLAYAPAPAGLFPFYPVQLRWDERKDSLYEHIIEEKEENGVWLIRNRTDRIIEITDEVTLSHGRPYRIEGLNFNARLSVVDGGRLELYRVEAVEVQVDTFSTIDTVLIANDSLFNELSVGNGKARLDSCTILTKAFLSVIDAVDCIFMDMSGTSISGVVQYSRIPDNPPVSPENMTIEDFTTTVPEFFGKKIDYDIDNKSENNGAGVLQPDCSKDIYAGASDDGEMGYFHHGRKSRPVRIAGIHSFELAEVDSYPLDDLIFEDAVKVSSGKLRLGRTAVREITVETSGDHLLPILDAKDCLFDKLTVSNALTRLEHCTVMENADCKHLQASDCIFNGSVTYGAGNEPLSGCLRYSRIPHDLTGSSLNVHTGRSDTNTRAIPIFNEFSYCEDGVVMRRLVFDPNDPVTIYAGSHGGGVFKSVDAGANWSVQNTGLSDLDIQALVIDPNNSAIIYAGTYGGGVFRWDTSGGFWLARNNGLTGPYGLYIHTLVIDAAGKLYAGSHGGGVFKSLDAGDNWSVQSTGLSDLDIQTLVIDASDPAIIYAGSHGGGVFKSVDAGANWSVQSTGLSDLDIQTLVIDASDPAIIYAGSHRGGVFKSVDAGANWSEQNTGLSNLNVQALAIDLNDSAIIYAATYGGDVFISHDAGLNWVQKRVATGINKSVRRNARFAEPGYGVLDPVTPHAIRFGAENGGEMGACHHKYYSLKVEAMLDKMREFLPVGIEPVLIFDTALLHVPPETMNSSNGGIL